MNNSSYYPGNFTGDDADGYDDLYDPPLAVVVFLSLCYGSISVAAVAGNGLVIWVILTSRRMRNVTNYYIANLALADIAIGMFAIPFEVSKCPFQMKGMSERQINFKRMYDEKKVEAKFGLQDDEKARLNAVPIHGLLKHDERNLKPAQRCGGRVRSRHNSQRFSDHSDALYEETHPRVHCPYRPNCIDPTLPSRVPSKLLSNSSASNSRDNFGLPTSPPSSSDEFDFGIKHQVPPKEEAHMEKSAWIDALTQGKPSNERFYEDLDDSELSDRSCDLYVPRLLKIPPKITSKNPSYSSDSSVYTDPIYQARDKSRERNAWNHKYQMKSNVAPYSDAQIRDKQSKKLPHSRAPIQRSQRIDNQTNVIESILPKAGRSILKKSSLPLPPSDRPSDNPLEINVKPVKHQTVSGPAHVVTERHLKASPRNPADPDGLGMRGSEGSRATPERFSRTKTRESVSIDTSKSAISDVSSSVPTKNPPIKGILTRKQPSSRDDVAAVTPNLQCESSMTGSLKQKCKKNIQESVVFSEKSLVSLEQVQKTESQMKYRQGDVKDLQGASVSSDREKLKKLKVIGPTKKKCFNLDIGQGINCINYLKANAPGADELQKRDLVELLVTPIDMKKATKTKAVEIDSSVDSVLMGHQSMEGLSSKSSILKTVVPTKYVPKVRDETVIDRTPLVKSTFKTLDQIYKEVHGINSTNTPKQLVENDYEYEAKKKQRLSKHKM